MAHACEHPNCDIATEGSLRFCALHIEERHLTLTMLEVKCPACGQYVPGGLLWHDCAEPPSVQSRTG
jgi:hypothetical protein